MRIPHHSVQTSLVGCDTVANTIGFSQAHLGAFRFDPRPGIGGNECRRTGVVYSERRPIFHNFFTPSRVHLFAVN